MWYRNCTRRELLDLLLAPLSEKMLSADYVSSLPKSISIKDNILLGWRRDPAIHVDLPCLAVVGDKDLPDLLALVNASPQAPTPFTSFCRLVSKSDFLAYGDSVGLDLVAPDLSPFISLSYAEALLHAEGQIKLADVSPAICERTLSLTWAKAMSKKIPFEQLANLTDAWIEAYLLSSDPHRNTRAQETVSALFPVLRMLTELQLGLSAASAESELCLALMEQAKDRQETAWLSLTRNSLPEPVSIAAIGEATREQRGAFFQQAVRLGASPFVLAFLATQISPGSLDHMELTISQKDPSIVFWYAALASLVRPQAVMTLYGGQGLRLQRIASRDTNFEQNPQCDISISELRVLARIGFESLAKKVQHANEISIELVPLISGTFRFPAKLGRSSDGNEHEREAREKFYQDRTRDRLLSIARMLEDLAHTGGLDSDSNEYRTKRSTRR